MCVNSDNTKLKADLLMTIKMMMIVVMVMMNMVMMWLCMWSDVADLPAAQKNWWGGNEVCPNQPRGVILVYPTMMMMIHHQHHHHHNDDHEGPSQQIVWIYNIQLRELINTCNLSYTFFLTLPWLGFVCCSTHRVPTYPLPVQTPQKMYFGPQKL